MLSPSVCIAILNWNGIRYLEYLLPSLLRAVEAYRKPCPVIVLDNQSTEPDREWIEQHFPEVELILAPKNDYLFSYNWLLSQRDEEIVILLNNDLWVDDHFIEPLLQHFVASDVFAASSRAYDWEGESVISGPFLWRQHRGWFYCHMDISHQEACYTLFPSGGYMAVDRKKFLELGGFNELFYPAYGEDLDLGFRAWCKGWKSIYEPSSIVFHQLSGSWEREEGKKTISSAHLTLRAQFLFQWQYLNQPGIRIQRVLYTQWLRLMKYLSPDMGWLETYEEAKRVWKLYRKHKPKPGKSSLSISEIRAKCGQSLVQ